MVETRLVLALGLATIAAYLLTPVAIRAAAHFDFYDKPQGYKGHATATPYLGGSAVMGAFLLALLVVAGDVQRTGPIAFGAAVLWVVGTIDDRRNVSAGVRVLIELGLAAMLWTAELGWNLGAGTLVDLAATCFWVIAVVNAINLFDNMDGASSTIAFVVSMAVAVLGLISGDGWLTAAGAALGGACLGFLPYNLARPNARIFLGDGGSMPVGFVVAALVMTGASDTGTAAQALVLGLLLVGLPALDTALVIISRRRKGISILTGGRDHLTHRTRRRLRDARAVALTLGAVQALIASVALVAVEGGSIAVVGVTVAFLAVAGGIVAVLEREEDRLHAQGELRVSDEALGKAAARRERQPRPVTAGDITLGALAVGAGLSALFFGFYDSRTWVPLGLSLVVVAAMGAIRRPPQLAARGWLALGGLVGLGLLSLLSARWAGSADQAMVDGNRWLVLAVTLGLALVLLRSARRDAIATGGLALGVLAVAAITLVRMLGSNGSDVFLGGRLHEPLGYINAEATVFLMGVWLCFAIVERREAWAAGAGMAGSMLLAALTLLSQSRGVAIAAIVSAVAVVVVLPGRQRRIYALIVLVAGLAAAQGPLLGVADAQVTGGLTDGVVRGAARAALLASLVTGLVWGIGVLVNDRLLNGAVRARVARVGRIVLIGGAAGLVVLAVAASGRISATLDTQWAVFTQVGEPTGSIVPAAQTGSRLVSGSGNRYDYWRVAWEAFKDDPVKGLGAGNFDEAWFASRSVFEDVRQPHSIELQAISDLGAPGGVLLLLFVAGMGWGIVRIRRVAVPGTAPGGLAVAAVGVTMAWLVHTSVDWQHLIPGVTAIALLMLGVLVRHRGDIEPAVSRVEIRPVRIALAVGVGLLVAISGATLTRQGLADHYRTEAFRLVATEPERAIREADRSLRLNDEAVRSYYAKAAALARLDRGDAATNVLLAATKREPRESVTWALLGDLATRRGLDEDARRYYRTALSLNPRDPGLIQAAGGGEVSGP